MNYPTDWKEELRKKPICGVLSVAIIANVTFEQATQAIKNNLMPHQKRHGGRTYHPQRRDALRELGVSFIEHYFSKMTLQRWVADHARPDTTYMVQTSSHVVTVRNGLVADQVEIKNISEHNSRRCFVRTVLQIRN